MRRLALALIALLMLRADMYPDASNATANALTNLSGAVYGGAYGMKCTAGATDDTAALQAAVNAAQDLAIGTGGGVLYLPAGICKISSTIAVADGGITIAGAGQGQGPITAGTVIRDTRTSGDAFSITSQSPVVFRDLSVDSNPNWKTSGGCFRFDGISAATWNNRSRLENVFCRGAYDGLTLVSTNDFVVDKSFFTDYSHNGITFAGSSAHETGRYVVTATTFFNQNRKYNGTMAASPFTTTNGSATVTVHSPAHTLVSGMIAIFTGATLFNNVTLNGHYVVTVTGADDFTVTANTVANASGAGGGTPYYWYGSNAAIELNGGNGTRISDSQFLGNCWNVLVRPLVIGGGDMIIKGNTLDQYHCASVGYLQGVAGQDASTVMILNNKFSMLPGQYGALAPANNPTLGSIYIGTGTPSAQPKWLSNGVIANNTFRNAVSAVVPMVDIEDGSAITLGPNSYTNLNISGMTGIKIGAAATNIVSPGGDTVYGIPSGFYDPAMNWAEFAVPLAPLPAASLPVCNAARRSRTHTVTDSNTAVFNAAVAAGGANVVIGFCNGAAWVVH